MPRSIKSPQTGSLVWYFATPAGGQPVVALVVSKIDDAHMNLLTFARVDGAATFVGNVFYTEGSNVASGAWCTYMRVNEPAVGAVPQTRMHLDAA